MQVFTSIDAAGDALQGMSLALGNFDGVHLGHRALFAAASRAGAPAVLTFSPHPGKVLQPALAPRLLCTEPRKLELLEEAGIVAVVLQPFTLDFARLAPESFEDALFARLRVAAVVVGYDFTYGAKRLGTVATLAAAALGRGAAVTVVPAQTVDGVVASSSRIREYLLEGRVDAAARLLGRPFDLDGRVVQGDQRGRTLGFPTANVDAPNELAPAPGVYAVRARVRGQWHLGAANLGTRPTFGGAGVNIEVHLLDFEQDVYGEVMRVQFVERLRAEQRFSSALELKAQIARDVEAARAAAGAAAK